MGAKANPLEMYTMLGYTPEEAQRQVDADLARSNAITAKIQEGIGAGLDRRSAEAAAIQSVGGTPSPVQTGPGVQATYTGGVLGTPAPAMGAGIALPAAPQLSPDEALAQLQKEQENLAKYGVANPTQEQINRGHIVSKQGQTVEGIITPSSIAPSTPTPYTPAPTTTYTTPTLTPEQQKAQSEIEKAQALANQMKGKTAYEMEQEAAAGLPGFQAQLNDYNAQMNALDAEAAGIHTAVQEASAGKGISTTIAGRQEQALLNQNTIKKLNLSVSINAIQGKIQTAKDQASRAVKLKYGPIEEELAIAKENLQLIINSPKYSAEEKAQALAMQKNLDAQEQAVKDAKAEKTAINEWKIKAAATGNLTAVDSAKFDSAKTEAEAAALAASYLAETKKLDTSIVEINGRKVLIDNQTGKTVKDLGKATGGAGDVGYNYNSIKDQLDASKGSDGYINTDRYKQLRGQVKDQTSFDKDFSYMLNPNDASARGFISNVKADVITPEQQSIINDAKAAIDQVKQRYGDWNTTRSKIIEQVRQQNGFDISPYI